MLPLFKNLLFKDTAVPCILYSEAMQVSTLTLLRHQAYHCMSAANKFSTYQHMRSSGVKISALTQEIHFYRLTL